MARVTKSFVLPSRTHQSFKQECDINEIMRRFRKSGDPDFLKRLGRITDGVYGDFSNVSDYRTALDQVARAADVFSALPARVRARFENDPAVFLDFCSDPANAQELIDLGLATPRVADSAPETPPQTQS